MNRRDFVRAGIAVGAGPLLHRSFAEQTSRFRTRHVIFIVNGGGARKKDWYENPLLCPNYARLVREGFVYEESYNDTVASHERAFIELITGRPFGSGSKRTVVDHVREAFGDSHSNDQTSDIDLVPEIMKTYRPRILIYRTMDHDVGHGNGGSPRHPTGYSEYLRACRNTDAQIGKVFDFIRNDPYFSSNTTIVIRPEFGRDDDVTADGELHHSTGYYQSHYSAELWWGPDIRQGVHKGLKNRLDVAPTLARLFNVELQDAPGQVHTEMFKPHVGD